MDSRKLQSLRNLGNECEEAADEIDRLTRKLAEAARAPLAEENARLKEQIERMDTVMEGMRSFWNEDHEGLEKARARIAELEAENQTLTRECSDAEDESDRLRAEVETLTTANAALVASNDAMQADAERYRWAREHTRFENDCEFWMPSVMAIDFKPGAELNGMHATLDAAIDAARKGEGE